MRPVLLGLILTVSLAGADSWWDWLLRVTGISATARNLKGEPHELEGDIWVKSLATQTSVRYTWDGSYRSPIFIPNDGGILAIKAGKVVKISSLGVAPEELAGEVGPARLLGFARGKSNKVAVLKRDPEQLGLLSLDTGGFTPLDATTQTDNIHQLWAWDTAYDQIRLYHRQGAGKETLDVFMERSGQPPENLTECRKADCGQPSLSDDGSQVAYIKRGLSR